MFYLALILSVAYVLTLLLGIYLTAHIWQSKTLYETLRLEILEEQAAKVASIFMPATMVAIGCLYEWHWGIILILILVGFVIARMITRSFEYLLYQHYFHN